MDMNIFLVIASYFIVFSLGYIISKLNNSVGSNVILNQHEKPISFLSQANKEEKKLNKKIEIDDKKFITEIKTDTLEKKFNELGKKTVAQDESLSANVSKLASLKKSKEE